MIFLNTKERAVDCEQPYFVAAYGRLNDKAAMRMAIRKETERRGCNNPNKISKWEFVRTGPSCGYLQSPNCTRPAIASQRT